MRPRAFLGPAVVALIASLLLFRSIGARYLWQDEAACAVMAQRMMETGKPYGYRDGNLITTITGGKDYAEFEAAITPHL